MEFFDDFVLLILPERVDAEIVAVRGRILELQRRKGSTSSRISSEVALLVEVDLLDIILEVLVSRRFIPVPDRVHIEHR